MDFKLALSAQGQRINVQPSTPPVLCPQIQPTTDRKYSGKKKNSESSLKAKLEFAHWNCLHCIRCFKYSTGDLQDMDNICRL